MRDDRRANRTNCGGRGAATPPAWVPALRKQKGSALLVTLMVIVGLSLLGLGFVSISETESQISVNERNYNQVLNIAEAGAKAVVEMFQDPLGMEDAGMLPSNLTVFKNTRVIDHDNDSATPIQAVDDYKSDLPTELLFDKPFKPNVNDRFFCSEQNPDIVIDRNQPQGVAFLDQLNEAMFIDNEGGEITEILVYAPPIVGATLNASECYDGGVRYGLATIRVTARKFDGTGNKDEENVIAQRTVKAVISEWPFPGPQGPVQSNANIATGGNLGVHWGRMTSDLDMEFANPVTALPWHDATNRVHFQIGYGESSYPWVADATRYVGQLVHPSAAAIAADPELKKYAYEVTTVTPALTGVGNSTKGAVGTGGSTEPAWPKAVPGAPFVSGEITYTPTWSTDHPIETAATTYNNHPWFYELMGKTFADPWMEVRAGGNLTNVAGTAPHPYKYSSPTQDETAPGVAGYSSWFEDQDKTEAPDKLEVTFPKMDYNFWKEIAIAGTQEDGVYYLKHAGGENYTDGVVTKNVAQWTNTYTDGRSGYFFFDTKNQLNPQGAGAPGILADPIVINSSDDNQTYQAQGFLYFNAVDFATKGINGVEGHHNSPGEPYEDIGFREVDETTNDWIWDGNNFQIRGKASGNWSFQDLAMSNGAGAPNGQFDVFVESKTVIMHDGTTSTIWVPVPYFPGCSPGMYGTAGVNCSEPHEPYLNLVYNDMARKSAGAGSAPKPFVVSFDPAVQTYLPNRVDKDGNPAVASCTSASDPQDCTSLRFDNLGALVDDLEPFLQGVLYNEGGFEQTTGNAVYYGSLLINKNVGKAGTVEVWFDEKLVKGEWPPDSFNFPRVLISSIRTDE